MSLELARGHAMEKNNRAKLGKHYTYISHKGKLVMVLTQCPSESCCTQLRKLLLTLIGFGVTEVTNPLTQDTIPLHGYRTYKRFIPDSMALPQARYLQIVHRKK